MMAISYGQSSASGGEKMDALRRLRIAHVTPYDLAVRGGVNASVVELVRRQSALGHRVDLIGGTSDARADVPNWRPAPSTIVRVPANGSVAALAIPTDAGPGSELERVVTGGAYDVVVVHEPAMPLGLAVLDVSQSATVGVMHAYSETLRTVAGLVSLVVRPDALGRSAPWLRDLRGRIA